MRNINPSNPLCCDRQTIRCGSLGDKVRFKCTVCQRKQMIKASKVVYINPSCPRCGSFTRKNGITKFHQKYFCPTCKFNFRESQVDVFNN